MEMKRILQLIKDRKPDIIHIQVGHPYLFSIIKELKKYTILTTIHDPAPHSGDFSYVYPLQYYTVLKNSKSFIVHGNNIKKTFLSYYGRQFKIDDEHIFIMPRGNCNIIKIWDKENINPDRNQILFFGRIRFYKGLDILILAMKYVWKKIPKAKLVIAGKSDFKTHISLQKLELYNDQRIEIQDRFIKNEEIPKLFGESSVIIFPYKDASISAGIPIAYSLERPVISTNVGSLSETVDDGKTGFIIEPNNPEQLAKKIIEILTNDELFQMMCINAKRKADNDLSWKRIGELTRICYEKTLSY